MTLPDVLETERLVLRRFRDEDFRPLLAFHSRADIARFLYWEPRTEADMRRVLGLKMQRCGMSEDGDTLDYAVVLAASGELVGDVTLILAGAAHRQGEIGYMFHPDHHGRGYATEASRPLLRLAFEELGLHRVAGRLDARNVASARVLEHLGMRREAHLVENEWVKGEWQSELVYAIRAADWRARVAQDPLQG